MHEVLCGPGTVRWDRGSTAVIGIDAEDLQKALEAMTQVASVLKRRFPNLTVNEANVIAKEIIYAVEGVTR